MPADHTPDDKTGNHALRDWLGVRISAVILIPLVLWMVYNMVALAGADHAAFTSWLAQPLNAALMMIAIPVMFYHAALGCHEIVIDYIHHEGFRKFKLAGINIFFTLAGAACLFSIYKIAFAAGV